MKRLLRGIIDFGSGLSQESMAANLQRLEDAELEWVQPADEKLHRFVSEFFVREGAVPSAAMMADFFQRKDDIEVLERLKDIKEATPFEGSNYKFVLGEVVGEQKRAEFIATIKQAATIVSKGLVIGEGREKRRLHGLTDAVRHLDESDYQALIEDKTRAKVRGDVRNETDEAWAAYLDLEANPEKAFGAFMGLNPIDNACKGLKRGELWVHAGHTGELKSTLAINWAYNLVTRYRRNVLYFCLEMRREHVTRTIYAMHSGNRRFELMGQRPLNYQRIRDGELTPEEKVQYETVLDDFNQNPEYCRFDLITPDGQMTIPWLKAELNRQERRAEVGMVIVDHSECMQSPSKDQNYGVRMNAVYTALRDLSLQFDGGRGIPILCLHQTNRQGKDRAAKEGRYASTSALSWANEAERSASVVTAGFVDHELRAANQVRIQCLKNSIPCTDPVLPGVIAEA